MKRMLALSAALLLSCCAIARAEESKDDYVLDYKMEALDGKQVDLNQYKGKVVLIVNTASECGLTPHYEGLQALHDKYADKGLVVLGFPCNQFGSQEPGSAKEIREFCTTNYGIKFPMFAKVEVNGDGQCKLYEQLTQKDAGAKFPGKIKWNFEKFVVGRDGQVVARFEPRTKPSDEKLVGAIEEQLGDK
ncbi:MAG: glutathione peroxidase [Pirellulaceae bacterium]